MPFVPFPERLGPDREVKFLRRPLRDYSMQAFDELPNFAVLYRSDDSAASNAASQGCLATAAVPSGIERNISKRPNYLRRAEDDLILRLVILQLSTL